MNAAPRCWTWPDFMVCGPLDAAAANALQDELVALAEKYNALIGGGFVECDENGAPLSGDFTNVTPNA